MPKSEYNITPRPLNDRKKQVLAYLKRQGNEGALVEAIVEGNSSFYNGKTASSTRKAQRDLCELESLGYAKRSSRFRWLIGDKPFCELDKKTAINIKMLEVFGCMLLDGENSRHIKELFLAADAALGESSSFKNLKNKIVYRYLDTQRQKPDIKVEVYEALVSAFFKDQKISFEYSNAHGMCESKKTSPLGIFFYQDIAYMVGYDGGKLTNYPLKYVSNIKPVTNSKVDFPSSWQGLDDHVTHISLLFANKESGHQSVNMQLSHECADQNVKDSTFSHWSNHEQPRQMQLFL